jgi:ABC-type antimicrobial peptide transport system permease subunit
VDESVRPARFQTLLLGSFTLLAMVTAIIGIYGVISEWTIRRTREIAIRLALGARPKDVMLQILRRALLLTGVGIVIGILSAQVLTRSMAPMLFGIHSTDVVTVAAVSASILTVAALATYLPARRAANVNPQLSLQAE